MKKCLICMIGGLLGLIGCGTKAPEGDLLSLEYTISGMRSGYEYEGHVEQGSDSAFVLTAMKESYGPLYQKRIGKEEVNGLRQIVLEEKMYGYKERYSPIFKVLDGYSWHLRVRFSDGTSISSGGSNARPEGDGLKRLENYLNQLIADADSILR